MEVELSKYWWKWKKIIQEITVCFCNDMKLHKQSPSKARQSQNIKLRIFRMCLWRVSDSMRGISDPPFFFFFFFLLLSLSKKYIIYTWFSLQSSGLCFRVIGNSYWDPQGIGFQMLRWSISYPETDDMNGNWCKRVGLNAPS